MGWYISSSGSRRRGHGYLPNRQLDPEYGALSRLTRDPDGAAMPLNNTLTQRQPQASAHAGRFGGKEGFKDARPDRWRDPRPVIHDLQGDPRARRVTACRERHLPWGLHLTQGLVGIGDEIHEHLPDLIRIGPYGWEIGVQAQLHGNAVDPERWLQQLQGMRNEGVEIHRDALGRVLARQGQEIAHQPLTACGRLGNLLGVFRHDIPGGLFAQQVGLQQDHGQGIIQLMRHARQQRPHSRELFALTQRLLLVLQLLGSPLALDDPAQLRTNLC